MDLHSQLDRAIATAGAVAARSRLALAEDSPGGERDKTESKNPNAVALGHRGGLKGGPARAKDLTPKERRDIAAQGAAARWGTKQN